MKVTIKQIEKELLLTFANKYGKKPKVYGVPRGGWFIALLIDRLDLGVQVDSVDKANVIVDDIIDSGRTRSRYFNKYMHLPFYAVFEKEKAGDVWFEFPWEGSKEQDGQELVVRMLEFIGENPNREGLTDTPWRVIKAWKELYSGYHQDPKKILSKIFESSVNQMVICKDIEFYSTCEHHLIPFFGKAHIGYLPNGKVVGLSKLARLVDVYARRLQLQENLTQQIADAIVEYIPECRGSGVVIEAQHLCMCSRGIAKQNSYMKTSALNGIIKEDIKAREEFFKLIA